MWHEVVSIDKTRDDHENCLVHIRRKNWAFFLGKISGYPRWWWWLQGSVWWSDRSQSGAGKQVFFLFWEEEKNSVIHRMMMIRWFRKRWIQMYGSWGESCFHFFFSLSVRFSTSSTSPFSDVWIGADKKSATSDNYFPSFLVIAHKKCDAEFPW